MNKQPPEGIDLKPDGSLEVVAVWESIQGEGPLVGTPAVFVRLAGCNLACSFCDTDYTSGRERYTVDELVVLIQAERSDGLVVLTGGEPLRQNIVPLAEVLIRLGYRVQIETNGTLYLPGLPYHHKDFMVVCSPKTGTIRKELRPCIAAMKYVVWEGQHLVDGIPFELADPGQADVFIQPLDEGRCESNRKNDRVAVSSCLDFGYRLSLQVHKIVGLE